MMKVEKSIFKVVKISIVQPKNDEVAQKSILKTSIRGPLVAIVLLLTLGLTTLFYFSQDSKVDIYSRYVESLSEYKFLESRLMRPLERVRYSLDEDPAAIEAGLMTLREIAVSVSASLENSRQNENWGTSVSKVDFFEREVLNKVSVSRRFLKERKAFLESLVGVEQDIEKHPDRLAREMYRTITRQLVMGVPLNPESIDVKDSVSSVLAKLSQENLDQMAMWSRIDNVKAILWAEDLIIDFKNRSATALEWKSAMSLIFYLLSLAMLLITLLLYVRVKND